jgi:hypothetical protein
MTAYSFTGIEVRKYFGCGLDLLFQFLLFLFFYYPHAVEIPNGNGWLKA